MKIIFKDASELNVQEVSEPARQLLQTVLACASSGTVMVRSIGLAYFSFTIQCTENSLAVLR